MGLIVGLLLNTVLVVALIVWLSKGDGAKWINTLNGTALSTLVVLFVIMETAGAVNGMFIWAVSHGKEKSLGETLGYLGIWFGFLGTHVLAISATLVAKRVTDGTYVEKKGAAAVALQDAKTATAAAVGSNGGGPAAPVTGERPAMRPSQSTTVIVEGDSK